MAQVAACPGAHAHPRGPGPRPAPQSPAPPPQQQLPPPPLSAGAPGSALGRGWRGSGGWAVGRRPAVRHVSPGIGGVAVVAELLRLCPVEVEMPVAPGGPGGGRPWGRSPAPPGLASPRLAPPPPSESRGGRGRSFRASLFQGLGHSASLPLRAAEPFVSSSLSRGGRGNPQVAPGEGGRGEGTSLG